MSSAIPAVLTRPVGDNEELGRVLRSAGIETFEKPLLSIQGKELDHTGRESVLSLDRYDAIIFVSRNSVRHGIPVLQDYWPQWPVRLSWFAVGKKTAQELHRFDVTATAPPEPGGAALLSSVDWTTVQRALIVRGSDGLEQLGDGLAGMGIRVDYLAVYDRRPIPWSEPLPVGCEQACIVVYSGSALLSLCSSKVLGPRDQLGLIVPSDRICEMAVARGFERVQVCRLEANAILDAVKQMQHNVKVRN